MVNLIITIIEIHYFENIIGKEIRMDDIFLTSLYNMKFTILININL
jgi:hypothetical protein